MGRKSSVIISALLLALLPVAPALAAAPTVTNVTSSVENGTKGFAWIKIPIQVTFSEIVNVTGVPTLELETGPTDRLATYVSGTGTTTLTFDYFILNNDTSADLDYTAAATLDHAGDSTIKNAGNQSAVLTLPAPGTAGSLGANKAIVIDAIKPTGTVTTASIGSAGTATVQSNELGFVWLVKSTNSPTSSSQVQALPNNERTFSSGWSIDPINTNSNLPVAGLVSGTYKLYAYDRALNFSLASTNTVTIDAQAPAPSYPPPFPSVVSNTSRIPVSSNEIGNAYLVKSTVVVTNLASITAAETADTANVNSVNITEVNTLTSLPTTGLNAGSYLIYVADEVGNLSPGIPSAPIGTDSSAPTITTATPFTGETQAGVTASLVIKFNEPVAKFVGDSSKTITLVRSVTPTITTGSLTTNVATLTFSSNPGLIVGDKITTTSCSNPAFNVTGSTTAGGTVGQITAVSGSTISFAKTSENIAPGAITGCAYPATKNDGSTNLITKS